MLPCSCGVSADEEFAVVKVRHWQSGLDEPLSENPHELVTEAHRRLPECTAVVAVQPGRIFPWQPIDEHRASPGRRSHAVGFTSRIDLPVKRRSLVMLARLKEPKYTGDPWPVIFRVTGGRELDRQDLRKRDHV